MPFVAFAAGSLMDGAFLHMITAGLTELEGTTSIFVWVLIGFSLFFILE
jgi:zinc and cadmium transporter